MTNPENDAGTGTEITTRPGTDAVNGVAGTNGTATATAILRPGTPSDTGTGTSAERRTWFRPFRISVRGTDTPEPAGTAPPVPAAPTPVPDPVPSTALAEAARTEAALRAALRRTQNDPSTKPRRRAGTTGSDLNLPNWMRVTGTWLSAFVGELPLISPLAVSGWYTFHVGTEALHLPWAFALLLVGALEGAAWKLINLYRMRLVAGIGTIAERLGLMFVVAAIGGLIYWHATTKAGVSGAEFSEVIAAADWRPASAAAAMAALGVFIKGRQARWDHREELRAAGRLDMQALRIGVWSWLVSPWESFWSFRHGMKYRISVPAEAVRDWRLWKDADKPKLWPPALPGGTGPGGTPVQVPARLLAELTGSGTADGTAPPVPSRPVPDRVAPSRPVPSPADSDQIGTAGTSGTGTEVERMPVWSAAKIAKIEADRERHRERLVTVRNNLGVDEGLRWDTLPADAMPLSRITKAGRFENKTYAREIKDILLYDRRPMAVADQN